MAYGGISKKMDAAAKIGRNPVSKHQTQPEWRMGRLTRDGTAEPVSRDQILRRERGQGNTYAINDTFFITSSLPRLLALPLARVY